MSKHFEDFKTPWHIIFSIIGLLFILGSNFAIINHILEGILILIGWIFLLLSVWGYFKNKRNKK